MKYARKISFSLLLCLVLITSVDASSSERCQSYLARSEMNDKALNINMTGIGIVTAWGVTKWDYFSRSAHANPEGWFANDTDDGGADKLGHFYTSYLVSHGLAYLYEKECFNESDGLYGVR